MALGVSVVQVEEVSSAETIAAEAKREAATVLYCMVGVVTARVQGRRCDVKSKSKNR